LLSKYSSSFADEIIRHTLHTTTNYNIQKQGGHGLQNSTGDQMGSGVYFF